MPDDVLKYLGIRRVRPLTCLADVGELTAGPRSRFDAIMPMDHSMRQVARKWWEWDYIADCAEQLGLLNSGVTALGLGVGEEPLIFYFANACKKVIATDLYSHDTAWSEARFADAAQVLDASPIPYPRDRVSVINADMRSIGVEDGSIDFVWSCSSIEHVPTLSDLFSVFAEIHRVLKPGGHAILTTEFSVTGNTYLLPGVNAWNLEILDLFEQSLPGFTFVGPLDLSFNSLHAGNAARPRRYLPPSGLPIECGTIPFYHSGGTVALPAGLSILAPIAFVLRKSSQAGVLDWEKAPVPAMIRTYTAGVRALGSGNFEKAISSLGRVYEEAGDDPQMRHFAFRFLIEARARAGRVENRDGLVSDIEEFLRGVPAGPVQDADCLDLCGHLLEESGRVDAAVAVYERCLLSPSTSRAHVLQLAMRFLALADGSDEVRRSVEFLGPILADLISFGMAPDELARMLSASTAVSLSPNTKIALWQAVNGAISASNKELPIR